MDFTFATATALVAAMAARQVSSVEVTTAVIEHIKRYNPALNALCVPDFENALTAARHADERRSRGEGGVLSSVPLTIKESFNIGGLPTTWGIPPFKSSVAKEDALAVARLKAAGAVVLGKTNVPTALADLQTYNPIYGVTNNPWDVARTPGGSSGGSAAALAAGFGALSMARTSPARSAFQHIFVACSPTSQLSAFSLDAATRRRWPRPSRSTGI